MANDAQIMLELFFAIRLSFILQLRLLQDVRGVLKQIP
jgi:hypothetical protein